MRRVVLVLLWTLCACHGGSKPGPPDMAFVGAFAPHDKVDLLFVLADFTVIPKRNELVKRFPQLIAQLATASPASYHIGVISTDLGAGPFTYNSGQCHPDGDGAKLLVGPAPSTVLSGGVSCNGFGLAGGARYIDYDRIAGTTNIVGVPDVVTAFDCMSAISDAGCPYFQALEAAYPPSPIRRRRTAAFCATTRSS